MVHVMTHVTPSGSTQTPLLDFNSVVTKLGVEHDIDLGGDDSDVAQQWRTYRHRTQEGKKKSSKVKKYDYNKELAQRNAPTDR